MFRILLTIHFASNGVMQPFRELNWWKWMYYLSPFTYIVEGLTGASKR